MAADDASVLLAFPDSAIDYDNIEFYRGLLERRFLVNRCAECGHWHVPAQPICPKCWSNDVVPTEVSGAGTVYMLVWLHHGAPPSDDGIPDPVATVELVEQPGLRVSTVLPGVPTDVMQIGLTVQLGWDDRSGVPLPVFVPAEAQATGL